MASSPRSSPQIGLLLDVQKPGTVPVHDEESARLLDGGKLGGVGGSGSALSAGGTPSSATD
jgi:hypothetical protein